MVTAAVMTLAYWLGHRFFSEVARGFFDHRVIGREPRVRQTLRPHVASLRRCNASSKNS